MLGQTPIHPETPAGSDIRYDPDFEALQTEIDKLSSPSSIHGVDWRKVSDLAVRILSEKSKDLTVASYLAVSHVHLNGIDGLDAGVTILRDLLKHYWETLFPPKKRMRGRIGAIYFWMEKIEAPLGALHETVEMEKLIQIRQNLLELDELLTAHMPDPPLMHSINRHINTFIDRASKTAVREPPSGTGAESREAPSNDAPAKAAPPESRPQKISTTAPAAAIETDPGEVGSEQDAIKDANAGFQKIRNAGVSLFEKDAKNPDAYRYRRIASWTKISSPPPASNGKTQIAPPSADEINAIERGKADNNWRVLLSTTEQKLSRFIFWLDLCRLSAEALDHMGEDCQKARKALCDETAFFMMRVPGIDDLAFSDGMPFADAETRQWLKDIALGAISDGSGEVARSAAGYCDTTDDDMSEIMEKAKSLAQRKKIKEAVGLVQEQLQRSSSGKAALSWRMALSRILLGAKHKQVAVPHIDQIIADIDNYHLERWDPDMALKGLVLAWNGFHTISDNRSGERADEVLQRISRLDPAEALRLSR